MQWSSSLGGSGRVGSGRVVRPEHLDALTADDPRALHSRRDLRRIHRVMRSVSILQHAIADLELAVPPRRILELGAGDGSLLLRFACALRVPWQDVQVTLLDRLDLLDRDTRARFGALGWEVDVVRGDALAWAAGRSAERYDLCLTTLFLHHFQTAALRVLLAAVADRSTAFVACEPRRNSFSRCGGRLLGFLGANEVTRSDGLTSVAAGFAGDELTSLWPSGGAAWRLAEYLAWPFTHCFLAHRFERPGA